MVSGRPPIPPGNGSAAGARLSPRAAPTYALERFVRWAQRALLKPNDAIPVTDVHVDAIELTGKEHTVVGDEVSNSILLPLQGQHGHTSMGQTGRRIREQYRLLPITLSP